MPKRTGWLGRVIVIAVAGIVFGLAGGVGESVAQDNMKKDDTMKTGDKTKSGDTMKTDGMKGDMKSDDVKKDGKAMMKDDKMMQGDKTMEKKQ